MRCKACNRDGIEYFCSDPFIYKVLLDEDESLGDDDG